MKYKKMLQRLQAFQKAYDALPQREKDSRTKPGSVKCR